MTAERTCPRCGATLLAGENEGLCPRCLMQAGLETEASAKSDPRLAATTPPVSPSDGSGFRPPPPEELAARFPQFEIIELLGHGGMGAVYKARQKGLDRLAAVKILPPEVARDPAFAERFTREARALARLNHANIVSVYDFGEADGLFYIVMEFVEGVNVRQMIAAGELQPDEALAIVPQICEALQFAHDEGVVHRDIKPENILIDKKGRVKIADFGLAKLARDLGEASLTGTHQVMGTPRYMAPEQMEGTRAVDHRADIYSLGVVFYEMLTGELPLGRFAPPSKKVKVDVRLDEVVLRTLEKEPELRYQHASDVKTAVDEISGVSAVAVERLFGREYKSQATLFGLPLVHIAFGLDPKTGRPKVAKGIVAIGNSAVGVVAAGGMAFGGIALGGLGLGIISFAGMAIGLLLAIGGGAVGGVAFGGGAVGIVAVGGAAVGVYAKGGAAWGVHPHSASYVDPQAETFFTEWADTAARAIVPASLIFAIGLPVLMLVAWLVASKQGGRVRDKTASATRSFAESESHREDKSAWACAILGMVMFVLGILLPAALWPFLEQSRENLLWIALACQALAVIFGLLGWRYRIGKVAVVVPLILAAAMFSSTGLVEHASQTAAPKLISPVSGALLPHGVGHESQDAAWEFTWSTVRGADRYQLVVQGASGQVPLIDLVVDEPRYRYSLGNLRFLNHPVFAGTWKVRAQVDGNWSEWSESRPFEIAPLSPAEALKAGLNEAGKAMELLPDAWRLPFENLPEFVPRDLMPDPDAPRPEPPRGPRESSLLNQRMNVLKQLGVAMHLFAEAHQAKFPATGSYDADGKLLLSWRVHILPYIEQGDLHRKFRLDEPWDSEHNKKLIAQMPALYAVPPGANRQEGLTTYLVPRWKRTLFPGGGRKSEPPGTTGTSFGEITDGLSNTILLIEAPPSSAVIWTKPDDWDVDPAELRRGLFTRDPQLVLMADGKPFRLDPRIDDATLNALFTRDGGEAEDVRKFLLLPGSTP